MKFLQNVNGQDLSERINNFDEMVDTIQKSNLTNILVEKYNKKSKELYLKGSPSNKTPNERDIINIIIDTIPIIRIKKSNQNSFEIMCYNTNLNIWTTSRYYLESIFLMINDFKNGSIFTIKKINDLIILMKKSQNIPAIDIYKDIIDISDKIEEGRFDIPIDFANGRFNIENKSITSLKPSDLAINQLSYNISEQCEDIYISRFDDYFLGLANGHEQRALALKQLAYCAILGYNPEKKAINFYGKAGGGKSTFLKVLDLLSDNNSLSFTYTNLSQDDALAQIESNRLLIGYDNNDKIVINKSLSIFKSLVSKETFSYSVKYEPRGFNIFTGLFIQAFNEMPEFSTGSSKTPISDRMLLLEFNSRFRNTTNEITDYEQYFANNEVLSRLARYLLDTVEPFSKFAYSDDETKEEQLRIGDMAYKFFIEVLDNDNVLSNSYIPISHLVKRFEIYIRQNSPGSKLLSSDKLKNRLNEYFEDIGYFYKKQNNGRINNNEKFQIRPSFAKNQNLYNPDTLFDSQDEIDNLPNNYTGYFIKEKQINKFNDITNISQALEYLTKLKNYDNDDRVMHLKIRNILSNEKLIEEGSLEEVKNEIYNEFKTIIDKVEV